MLVVSHRPRRVAHGPAVPGDAGADRRRQRGAPRADHRHPRGAGVRARAGRGAALRARSTTTSPTPRSPPGGCRRSCSRSCCSCSTSRASPCCGSAPAASTAARCRSARSSRSSRYLTQILMAVMMATFMVDARPASRGVRRAHHRGARHAVVGRHPDRPRTESPSTAPLELRDVGFHYPGAEEPVLTGDRRCGPVPGETTRSSAAPAPARRRCSTSIPRLFDATGGAVLVDGVDVRDLAPRALWTASASCRRSRTCSPARCASNLRFATARRHRRGAVGGARDRPGRRLRAGDARRARRADRPGRRQRVGRPAPAAGHRPGPGAPARDLPLRRLVLRPRPRHRRPAAGRARPGHRATPPS